MNTFVQELAAAAQSAAQTGAGLPRVSQANSVPDLLDTISKRLAAANWLPVKAFAEGHSVKGVILIAAAQSKILNGKNSDGLGKAHKTVRTSVMVGTPDHGTQFLAQLQQMAATGASLDDLKNAWYAFQEMHQVTATVWEGDQGWTAALAGTGTFSGQLTIRMVDTEKRGTVPVAQIRGLIADQPATVHDMGRKGGTEDAAKTLGSIFGTPQTAVNVVRRVSPFTGSVHTEAELQALDPSGAWKAWPIAP